MKFFITGILGHCAPHLALLLRTMGHELHALVRTSAGRPYESLLDVMTPEEIDGITFHYGDLTDYQSLQNIFQQNKFDGAFHLGAQSSPPISFKDPIGTMRTNVNGTVYLAEAIIHDNPNCVLMNCSTSEVYGDSCKEIGILKEDMKLMPNNPYGWSKLCAETYITERCRNGLLKGFSTRAFSHLAPRRGKNFSISWDAYHLAYMKVMEDRKVDCSNILPVGNLQTQRIVVDARDIVKAYYLLMMKFKDYENRLSTPITGNKNIIEQGVTYFQNPMNGEAFNVAGDHSIVKKMEFFTDKLIEISGLKDVEKKIDPRVYREVDIQIQVADTTKLHNTIDWQPEVPIERTLTDIFNYWVKKLS